jgi:hypothetical protein
MRRGKTDTYPAFPEIEAQLGYNPARFLVPTDDARDELSWATRVKAFIRGLDDVETIRAWLTVEAALELGANGGPRKKVIKWLNQRQAVLEGTADQETADQTETRTQQSAAAVAEPPEETPTETDDAVAQTASDTTSADAGLAADGGATPDETPSCPECQGECTREEIAGQTGFWCPQCEDFREPVAMEERA